MTIQRLLAFDAEISKPIQNIKAWKLERPLGICCATTFSSDDDMRIWHPEEQSGGRFQQQLSVVKCHELARYLLEMQSNGYAILTWNGLDFDLNILAEECQDEALGKDLARLALKHIDILFAIFSDSGSLVSLDVAANGMGMMGKAYGLDGKDIPLLWQQSRNMQDKVMEYNAQDSRLTMALYSAICEKGYLRWFTKSGYPKQWKCECFSIPSVTDALTGPEPDTSWMDNPLTRFDFCEWIKDLLPRTELPYLLNVQS